MAKIVMPGDEKPKAFVRKKKDLEAGNYDATAAVESAVGQIWEQAQAAGFSSIKDFVKAFYKRWTATNDEDLLDELYSQFIDCVQQGISKEPWGTGKWDTDSSFEQFLYLTSKETGMRLEEIQEKLKSQYPSFGAMVNVLPDMTDVPEGVGEALSKEDADFYIEVLRKGQELCDRMLKTPELINAYLERKAERKEDGGS